MKLKLTECSCKYGAPMGRSAEIPDWVKCFRDEQKLVFLHLEKMPLVDGGCYDQGGAYWGCGNAETGGMWAAWLNDERGAVRLWIRARNREEAKNKANKGIPNAIFCR